MSVDDIDQSSYGVAVSTGSTGLSAVENVRGFSLRETAGSTSAVFALYEGTTNTAANLLWTVSIGANESVLYESNVRREMTSGVYVEVTGTTGITGMILL